MTRQIGNARYPPKADLRQPGLDRLGRVRSKAEGRGAATVHRWSNQRERA